MIYELLNMEINLETGAFMAILGSGLSDCWLPSEEGVSHWEIRVSATRVSNNAINDASNPKKMKELPDTRVSVNTVELESRPVLGRKQRVSCLAPSSEVFEDWGRGKGATDDSCVS